MAFIYKTAKWAEMRRPQGKYGFSHFIIPTEGISLGLNNYVSTGLFGFIHKHCMCPMEIVAIERSTTMGIGPYWLGPQAEGVLTWWLRCPACGFGGKIQCDLKWLWPLGLLEGVPEMANLPEELREAQKEKREELKANCPEAKAGKEITEKGYNAYLDKLGKLYPIKEMPER